MRRLLLALAMLAGVALLVAAPASAQYGGGGGGGTTTTTTTTTAPGDSNSGCVDGDDACTPRVLASVSNPVLQPGSSTTVSTPPVFAPGTEVTINLVRADGSATPALSEPSTTNSNGAVSDSITVPDVDAGVYFIYIVGQDADGNLVVAIVPVVVRNSTAAASVEGDSVQAASAAPVPAAVAEVQTDLPADTQAAIVDAVAAGDAGLLLSPQGELQVRTPQGTQAAGALATTGNDISGYVTAGAALLLAGTGLVLMRRRKEARL